jgi:hypothetical protein
MIKMIFVICLRRAVGTHVWALRAMPSYMRHTPPQTITKINQINQINQKSKIKLIFRRNRRF